MSLRRCAVTLGCQTCSEWCDGRPAKPVTKVEREACIPTGYHKGHRRDDKPRKKK